MRRALRTNPSVVRCAEKPEFVWWPLPMPPAFCTLSQQDSRHPIPHEHSFGTQTAPQSLHTFLQNSIWMRSRCAAVFVSSAKLASRHPGTITALDLLAPAQSCSIKLLLRQRIANGIIPTIRSRICRWIALAGPSPLCQIRTSTSSTSDALNSAWAPALRHSRRNLFSRSMAMIFAPCWRRGPKSCNAFPTSGESGRIRKRRSRPAKW